jgi:hypothetical protein
MPSNSPCSPKDHEPIFFQFEADFVESLRCIPMIVRLKLDTCGIKLKLDQWHLFLREEQEQLVHQPCTTPAEVTEYRQFLQDLIRIYTQSDATELPIAPHPAWFDLTQLPTAFQEKLQAAEVTVSLTQWQALSPLQRFALIKLSQPSHESKNFLPALQEFGLL